MTWTGRPHSCCQHGARRHLRRLWTGLALASAILAMGAPRAMAETAPTGTISTVGSLPNYFYTHFYDPTSPQSNVAVSDTGSVIDPVNHRIFEFNTNFQPQLVELDAGTFAVLASYQGAHIGFAGSSSPIIAIDPVDKLVLAGGTGNTGSPVMVLDEGTLHEVAEWQLSVNPSDPANNPQLYIKGLSWYAATDELYVLTDNIGPVPGVPLTSVTAINVKTGLSSQASGILWSKTIPGCVSALTAEYAPPSAFHSSFGASIYVPCKLSGVSATSFGERDGVVKLGLSPCPAPAQECANGTATTTVAPGVTDDFLFDPGSDRGFMPSIGSSVSLLAYDGTHEEFLGRSSVGTANDGNHVVFGLDTATGRLYAIGPGSGLTVIDGRRTPVSAGSVFPQYARFVIRALFPVAPPDAAHPYTRVFVNHDVGTNQDDFHPGVQPDFTVFADTLPVTQDPPPSALDANTSKSPIAPGTPVSKIFGGSARGYGFHADFVGAVANLLTDNVDGGGLQDSTGVAALPLEAGNRDILGGEVAHLSDQTGSTAAHASALEPSDDRTAYAYSACTDTSLGSIFGGACVPCPIPAATNLSCNTSAAPGATPSALPSPSLDPTTQAWPYPPSACSQPGPADQAVQDHAGAYATQYTNDGEGATQAQTVAIPGTTASADARVDCLSATPVPGTASASAFLRGSGATLAANGLPTVRVADASTQSSVEPPTAAGGLVSKVQSIARGVDIDLGSAGRIEIGTIEQDATTSAGGSRGTAQTWRKVTLSRVVLYGPGDSGGTEVCSVCDPGTVAATINADFPNGQLHVTSESPDDRYASACTTAADGATTCQGSAGGYIAAIEASQSQQFGDEQFNHMPAEEASYLPALRVVLYDFNDGNPAQSRFVLDLAGVEADAELGISAVPTETSFSNVDTTAAEVAAGQVVGGAAPDTFGGMATRNLSAPGVPAAAGSGGVLERALTGVAWLIRSPAAALQMLGFFGVLLLPMLIMRQRWTWTGSTRSGEGEG